jgi:carboxyl-terminal processing protease
VTPRRFFVALVIAACAATVPARAQGFVDTFDRAWTIVRDTHFDPKMNGVDWAAVREELRPRAVAATNEGELRAVIREMLGRLGLSHFALIPASADAPGVAPSDQSADPGFDVRRTASAVVVSTVDPNGPAARAGVRPGWIVRSIDGAGVGALLAHLPAHDSDRLVNL